MNFTRSGKSRVFNAIPMLVSLLACVATAQTVELIADPAFQQGLCMTDHDGKRHVVLWNTNAVPPVWETAQHYSKSSFADEAFQSTPNGVVFKDDFQMLSIHPMDAEADFVCGINGSREFGNAWRLPGDPWPHLYLSQRISDPGGHLGVHSPVLANIEKMDFSMGIKLLYDRKQTGPAYSKQQHAAQFLFFLTVQNLNRNSKGFGDYYWFTIALYDDRHAVTPMHTMPDIGSPRKPGTDKIIYNIGIEPFTDKVVADGEWVSVKGDLLPHIIAGLRECWRRGYLADSQDLADYRLGGGVIGWEVTGLNDVSIAVKGLQATATLKANKP